MNFTQATLYLAGERDQRFEDRRNGEWVDELSQPEHWQALINFILSKTEGDGIPLATTSVDLANFPRTIGTHVTHCCNVHGCKYGKAECLVEAKVLDGWYKCEFCDMDEEQVQEVMEPVTSRFDTLIEEAWEEYVKQPANFGTDDHKTRVAEHDAFVAGARAIINTIVPF